MPWLNLPSMDYSLSISMSSDSLKIVFADGRQITCKPDDSLVYGTSEIEEKTIYIDGGVADTPWPIYRYRITKEHYNSAK